MTLDFIEKNFYLLDSSDKIKNQDYYIEFIGLDNSFLIHQATEKSLSDWNKNENNKDNFYRRCFKIIASTNIKVDTYKLNLSQCYQLSYLHYWNIDEITEIIYHQSKDEDGFDYWDEDELVKARNSFKKGIKVTSEAYLNCSLNKPLNKLDYQKETNQCDGCLRGLERDEFGKHIEVGSLGFNCTKHLYNKPELVKGYLNLIMI